jgi:splicing factor 3B subunit 1
VNVRVQYHDLADARARRAQGLFHPARKVREVYWKVYNSLYVGAQDALVAAYPRLEDDAKNTFSRQELDVFI